MTTEHIRWIAGLGHWLSWLNDWFRFLVPAIMLVCCLFSLALEISVLAEIYGEQKERKRQANKRPRKPDDASGLDVRLP